MQPPYAAFIQVADLPDSFVASLPGIRARVLAGNPDTRRSSSVLTLPPDWDFTTGGLPDKSVELYVIAGRIRLGEFELGPGGYAFIPATTTGLSIATRTGARILYFLDDANEQSVIGTPLILDAGRVAWETGSDVGGFGLATKTLREDPGSGARTWLLRIEPGAVQDWTSSSDALEGFMLEGRYTHAECVNGESVVGEYGPGGYFHRPGGAVHGGPAARAEATAVWYLRQTSPARDIVVQGCAAGNSVSP